jgi:hypothetical protein
VVGEDPGPDGIAEWPCPCCDRVYRFSHANLRRIARAIQLRTGRSEGMAMINMSRVPHDIDLTGDLTPEQVAQVAREASSLGEGW